MSVAWGNNATNAAGDSALNLTVTGLNLADWKAFAPDLAPAGIVNVNAKVLSQDSGQKLSFELRTEINDLAAKLGSNQIRQAGVLLVVRGQATDLNKVNLSEYRVQLTQQNQPALAVDGSGTYDLKAQEADVQTKFEAHLPKLVSIAAVPDVKLSGGVVRFTGRITQKNLTPAQTNNPSLDQVVVGTLQLENLTGQLAEYRFDRFETKVDCDLQVKEQLATIRKLAGSLTQAGQAGGAFDVSGNFDVKKKVGQFALNVKDLNQNALRPVLASALGEKTLTSISINATTVARYDEKGESSIKGDISVDKFLVKDPEGKLPTTPLQVGVKLDGSLAKQILDLRQLEVALSPTERAKNRFQLIGKVDMGKSNVFSGKMKLSAESLDFTPYYDLFADKKTAAATTGQPPAGAPKPATPAPPGAATEPAATRLPFEQFTFDVDIGRLYLRQVEIADWLGTVKLDGGAGEREAVPIGAQPRAGQCHGGCESWRPRFQLRCRAVREPNSARTAHAVVCSGQGRVGERRSYGERAR